VARLGVLGHRLHHTVPRAAHTRWRHYRTPDNHPALASKSCWLPDDLDSSYDECASCSNDDCGGAADNASAPILSALTARAIQSGFVTLSDGPRQTMRSMAA
jgi:hypothetical protein